MAQESILRIVIDSRNAERNAQALDRELRSIQRSGDFASRSTDGLSEATRQLASYMMGVLTVGAAIAKTDMYTGLRNRLKLVTEDQYALNKAMFDTFKIAQNTAQAWDSVAQIYQRFSDNSKRLNLTQEKTAALTDTVAKAISISGGSASSAEAALIQFSQALASNVLRGEELNSVMEQAPGLAKAIAQGMGITVGQLRSVAAEGKITGDVLVEALTKAKDSVDDLFAKTDFTIGQSLTQLSNAVTQFIGEAGQGSGAATMLSSSIKNLADNLDLVVNAGTAVAMGYVAKSMMLGAMATSKATYSLIAKVDATIAERQANIAATQAEVASAIAEAQSTEAKLANLQATRAQIVEELRLELRRMKMQFSTQGTINSELRMALLRQQQVAINAELLATETALAASSTRLSVALAAQAAATSRLALGKAALMAMFSPMGIAIAATAAAFYFLSSSAEEVKESLATQSESVEALTKKYLELNSVQAQVESVRLRKEVDAQKDSIDDAESSIGRFIYLQKELFKISGDDYKQYKQAIKAIATGADDAGVMLQKMVASGRFSQDQVDRLVEYSGAVADSKNKINQNNTALELLTKTSGQHTVVTKESTKQLADQAGALKIATQNFSDMKAHVIESLQVQVEFAKLNSASKDQVKTLNGVIKQYSSNQISATDAVSNFNASAKMPGNVLIGLQNYATKTDGAKKEVNSLAEKIKQLNILSPNTVKATDERAAAADREKKSIEDAKKAYDDLRDAYAKKNLSIDFDLKNIKLLGLEMGKAVSEFYDENKIPKTRSLTSGEWKEFQKHFDKQQALKQLEDEITEAKRKQNKENEKQYQYKQAEIELLRKAYGDVSKSGLGAYAESKGIPANVIAGLYMQESKAGTDLTSHTGAKGNWQTTRAYRKRYNISMEDNNDFLKVGKIVVDNIAKVFNETGSLKQAILSHNAGEAGAQRFMETGRVKGSADRNKEVAGYLPSIDKWASWGDGKKGDLLGSDDSGKAYQKFLDDQKKLEEETQQLRERYSSEDITRNQQRLDTIAKANELGLQHLIPDIEKRYTAESKLAELSYNESLSGYQWSEQQKIVYARDRAQQELILSTQYSDKQKKVLKKAIDDQAKYELAVFDETQRRKAQELSDVLTERQKQSSDNQLRILAQANMSPDEFARWNLQNNMTNDISYAFDDYQKDVKDINRKDEAGRFEIEDANYRNQLLQQAERTHQAKMLEIKEDYAAQAQDLDQQEYETKMQVYGQIAGMVSQTFDQMASMLKESAGESSALYKSMFLTGKAASIAQAIVNTEEGATKALAQGGMYGSLLAGVVRATGYASVGMIAGQTIASFATGGHVRGPGTSTSDSIPAMLSDYEFVTKASAVKKIGVANMEYMNRTGEMPFQKEYEELHKRIAGNQLPEPFIVPKYKDGGLVGSSRVQPDAYSQIYREKQLADKQSPEAKQVRVTVINQTSQPVEATSQWDGDELQVVLTEMRKQNEAMMDAKIEKRFRMANRQGWK